MASTATRRSRRLRSQLLAWLFLTPLMLINAVVIAGPATANLYYSFTDWTGLGSASFTGLDNYHRLLGDEEFRRSLIHNAEYTGYFLTVPIAMGLGGAYLLSKVQRFRLFFRISFFLPYMAASVVIAAIWKQLLSPDQGLATIVPALDDVYFFGDPSLALPSIAFVDNWHWWGFIVVLFLTAMQAVDSNLYEAAEVDGAGEWRKFWHVTLPGIRPTLVFVVLITIIGSLLVFDYVYIITNGGPAGASEVVATLAYKEAFDRFDAGYAAAMGLTLSALAGVVVAVFVGLRRRGWDI